MRSAFVASSNVRGMFLAKTESWLGIISNHVQFVRMYRRRYSTSTRVTASTLVRKRKELKMAAKNKQIKKIISWVVGLPAAIIAISEPTDLRLWWVQFAAIAVLAVVLFANGVFDETIQELKSRKEIWR